MTGPRSLPGRAAFRGLHLAANRLGAGRRRLRRRRLAWSVATRAWWGRAAVELHLAPDLRLGRRVRVEVEPRTRSVLRLGPAVRIGDDVRIELRGGTVEFGRGVDVRRGCTITAGGRLWCEGPLLVQPYSSLHCDEAVELGAGTGLGEHSTVIDSTHSRGGDHAWWLDNIRTAPVRVGRDVWVGAKATVGRGVTVGDGAVVAANSLVVSDVPAGRLVSGVPAVVREPSARRPARRDGVACATAPDDLRSTSQHPTASQPVTGRRGG